MSPERVTAKESTPITREYLREHLYIAQQASEGGLPVLPGVLVNEEMALYYSSDPAARTTTLQGVLDGTIDPALAVDSVTPKALIYNVKALETSDLSTMMAKIRDITGKAKYYDNERLVRFVANMQGTGIDLQTTEAIYERTVQSRIRKILLDSYGFTGRQQITEAMREDAAQAMANFPNLPSGERIFEALKLNWATTDLQIIPSPEVERIISTLSESEKAVFDTLQQPYSEFVQSGNPESFKNLTAAVKSVFEVPQQEDKEVPEEETTSEETEESEEEDEDKSGQEGKGKSKKKGQGEGQGESQGGGSGQKQEMQDYTKDLDKVKNKVGPPQTPKDPAIPPDDKDEYHTSKEKSPEGVYYYISPAGTSAAPMVGYFAAGRKSYYDIPTKTWSKKKVVTPYKTSTTGEERQTISSASRITGGTLKALPIPNGYALDTASLKFSGSKKSPLLFRDQNGCFYIKASGSCSFSVDFLKEPILFTNPPIPDDTKPIYQGALSVQTESFMHSLTGSNTERALAVQKYIRANHVYPGKGNLEMAQALQYKLRQASPENYLQTIDSSKFLECYSTHTLFIAIMRKMGIPARLVIGDHTDKVKDKKAQLDTTTGHAWAEIWDGAKWVRVDATPAPEHKQEPDQKQDQDKNQEPGQQADDNGAEPGEEGEGEEGKQGEGGEKGEGQPGTGGQPGTEGKPGKSGKPRPDMKFQDKGRPTEASNQQMQQGQQNLQQAQETMKKIQETRNKLDQQVRDSKSFQEMENLKKLAEKAEIFDEMKKELEDKIKALEQAKKDELKEALEEMVQDGFVEEAQMEKLVEQIDEGEGGDLDKLRKQIERDGALHSEYLQIRARVIDKVEEKYEQLITILPTEQTMEINEDLLRRKGVLNRRAMMKPINLLMGTVKNPRVFEEAIKPLFLAGIAVDFSRSVMTMSPEKRKATEDLLVFVLELFDMVVQNLGYMRYSLTAFHDNVIPIKGYDQDYNSLERYGYPDGSHSTVKARLMKATRTEGGTYILPALTFCAGGLNQEAEDYPDYMSAFYFIGDGEDSNSDPRFGGDPSYYRKIKRFVDNLNPANGFGDHVRRAIFLGTEEEKEQLSKIFGEDNTFVCSDFDQLVDMFLEGLASDVQVYMSNKV